LLRSCKNARLVSTGPCGPSRQARREIRVGPDAEFYLKCRGQVSLPDQGRSRGLRHRLHGRASEAGAPWLRAPSTLYRLRSLAPIPVRAGAGWFRLRPPYSCAGRSRERLVGGRLTGGTPHQTFQLPHISLAGPVT
jgi:hypothetical protein